MNIRLPVANDTAASAPVTNTTDATVFGKKATVPANTLKAGDVLRIAFQGIATATNSTDTLAIDVMVGGVSVVAVAAVDVANDNIFAGIVDVQIRTIGALGTMVGFGLVPAIAAAGGNSISRMKASTNIDTTAAVVVGIQATWSVASASNSCRLDYLNVELMRAPE